MTGTEENWLHTWEQKILRKIYGRVKDRHIWIIKTKLRIFTIIW